MKIITEQNCKAIRETDPRGFEAEYIKALEGVKNPDIYKDYKDGAFIAIITWEETREQVESVKDEYHLEGLRFVCGQCPYIEIGDRRKKRHPCKYSIYSSVDKRQEACELFYKELKQGLIEPRDEDV